MYVLHCRDMHTCTLHFHLLLYCIVIDLILIGFYVHSTFEVTYRWDMGQRGESWFHLYEGRGGSKIRTEYLHQGTICSALKLEQSDLVPGPHRTRITCPFPKSNIITCSTNVTTLIRGTVFTLFIRTLSILGHPYYFVWWKGYKLFSRCVIDVSLTECRTVQTLIRLRECAGWSGSTLVAQAVINSVRLYMVNTV